MNKTRRRKQRAKAKERKKDVRQVGLTKDMPRKLTKEVLKAIGEYHDKDWLNMKPVGKEII